MGQEQITEEWVSSSGTGIRLDRQVQFPAPTFPQSYKCCDSGSHSLCAKRSCKAEKMEFGSMCLTRHWKAGSKVSFLKHTPQVLFQKQTKDIKQESWEHCSDVNTVLTQVKNLAQRQKFPTSGRGEPTAAGLSNVLTRPHVHLSLQTLYEHLSSTQKQQYRSVFHNTNTVILPPNSSIQVKFR